MEYRLKINEEIIPVQVEAVGEDNLKISMAEQQFDVACHVLGDNMIHLMVNGRSVNAYLTGEGGGRNITINGLTCRVEDADLLEQNLGRKKRHRDMPAEVTPPMPAVVVRVMVEVGDMVEKGQEVVVVTAMKMETTLNAPFGGKVTGVNAAAGDKVMPGQILVDIAGSENADG